MEAKDDDFEERLRRFVPVFGDFDSAGAGADDLGDSWCGAEEAGEYAWEAEDSEGSDSDPDSDYVDIELSKPLKGAALKRFRENQEYDKMVAPLLKCDFQNTGA